MASRGKRRAAAQVRSRYEEVSDEFDVFDERVTRVVDVATVLASNAELTDLTGVAARTRSADCCST